MLPCWSVSPLLYWPYERPYQNRWSSKELFTKRGRAIIMDAIPPTRGALVKHIKRTVYQGALLGQLQLLKSCHPLMTGPGLNHPAGNSCEPLCQNQAHPRGNYFLVAANKAAGDNASAIKQHWSVLPCSSAVDKTVMRKAWRPVTLQHI